MVASVNGVAFLDGDTMAVTSSTKGELFLVSKASQTVLRRVELDVKAESLCAVPGTRRVLVADGRGTLCCVDTATEPATVACVAGSAHHAGGAMRLTSVAAWDDHTCFAAGAVRGSYARVDAVAIGGAAWRAGAREGLCVVAVDGVACGGHAHALALQLLQPRARLPEEQRGALVFFSSRRPRASS